MSGPAKDAPEPGGEAPRSAASLADSIGVNVHSVYYDTAYANWGQVVAALRRLRIRHARDAIFANPAVQAREFNERYYRSIEAAARAGIRFNFIMGFPGSPSGSLRDLMNVAAGRLRPATESLEGPNEFDLGAPPGWPTRLAGYQRALYKAVRAEPRLRGVPVVGPSIAGDGEDEVGRLSDALDLGNMHPYTNGQPPGRRHVTSEIRTAGTLSEAKPLIATEAGFHNALNATEGQAPVPEGIAAGYVLRTVLEHYAAGVRRTYLYELLDEKPDPGNGQPEQHFGLLRNDFSEKPAASALRRLMNLLGDPRPPGRLAPLALRLDGDRVRHLLLQRRDGRHLLLLWGVSFSPATVQLRLPEGVAVSAYDITREDRGRDLPPSGASRRLQVGVDPVALLISGE